jgi:hypothetical protein
MLVAFIERPIAMNYALSPAHIEKPCNKLVARSLNAT